MQEYKVKSFTGREIKLTKINSHFCINKYLTKFLYDFFNNCSIIFRNGEQVALSKYVSAYVLIQVVVYESSVINATK